MGIPLSSRNRHTFDRRTDPSRLLDAMRRAPFNAKNYGQDSITWQAVSDVSNVQHAAMLTLEVKGAANGRRGSFEN